ncbi:hypothetical protein F5Y14DRAFT_454580 [Nemania sp. NC0429]|nr:hypothetical protein F5Y14DRAFT_454580 [Nemania sp. NC0429]
MASHISEKDNLIELSSPNAIAMPHETPEKHSINELPSPDSTAIPSQTSEKHSTIESPSPDSTATPRQKPEKVKYREPLCVEAFSLWCTRSFCYVGWLFTVWMHCRVACHLLNINVEGSVLGWSLWELFLQGSGLLLVLHVSGMSMELASFVAWFCLRKIRGQPTGSEHYPLLAYRFVLFVDILFSGTMLAWVLLVRALLPCARPRRKPVQLSEKQSHVGEKQGRPKVKRSVPWPVALHLYIGDKFESLAKEVEDDDPAGTMV